MESVIQLNKSAFVKEIVSSFVFQKEELLLRPHFTLWICPTFYFRAYMPANQSVVVKNCYISAKRAPHLTWWNYNIIRCLVEYSNFGRTS